MLKQTLFLLIIPLLLIPIISIQAQESENIGIPSWIKIVAGAWANDEITDVEYESAMEFLIQAGIIVIESVQINQVTLSDETERLYQLEIAQKEDTITILSNEVEDTGLDNATLLQSIVEKDETIAALETSLGNLKTEFKTYKDDYPLKVGNIGGKLVNADTIRELERKIKELEQELEEYR